MSSSMYGGGMGGYGPNYGPISNPDLDLPPNYQNIGGNVRREDLLCDGRSSSARSSHGGAGGSFGAISPYEHVPILEPVESFERGFRGGNLNGARGGGAEQSPSTHTHREDRTGFRDMRGPSRHQHQHQHHTPSYLPVHAFSDNHTTPHPPPEDNGTRAAQFMEHHTDFLSHSDTTSPRNDECPICLDGIEEHICVKIVGIEGCNHLIGMKCLEDMLKHDPEKKKECPLCRSEWMAEVGVWEDEVEGAQLGRGGAVRRSYIGRRHSAGGMRNGARAAVHPPGFTMLQPRVPGFIPRLERAHDR